MDKRRRRLALVLLLAGARVVFRFTNREDHALHSVRQDYGGEEARNVPH